MPLRAAIEDLRVVTTPVVGRRWLLSAVLVFGERILTPFAAWIFIERSALQKVSAAAIVGGVFAMRGLAQRAFLARTEGEFFVRIASSVLGGDVHRANFGSDANLRTEAAQAAYQTAQLLSMACPNVVGDGAAALVVVAGIALVEPARLVASALGLLLLAAGTLTLARRMTAATAERAWVVREEVYEVFGDALDGRLEIVASGARSACLSGLNRRTRAWSRASVRTIIAVALSSRLALGVVAGLAAGLFFLDSRARGLLPLTIKDVAVFLGVTPAFAGLAQNAHALARDYRWLRLVARVIGAARPQRVATCDLPPAPTTIALDRLSFRYPDAPRDALSSVSLFWSPDETLAFAGPNGTGKSTLLRLLLALASPTSGTICIGDVPLDALDADAWRSRVAFLPQRPYFPPRADVRAGVRWPASDADDARILAALDRVGLTTALRREQGDGGDLLAVRVDTLSVGQRQRVALARLLCRDAAVFLLDEPDANLDRDGILLVAELVRELSRRGMVAVAAHTPELLAAADRVITLEKESDPHGSPHS